MNKLPIYLLSNKRMEGAPEGATLIKGSTRVSDHNRFGSSVIVKIHNFYDNRGWVRVWINMLQKRSYTQTAIFENSWRDDLPHWYVTYCTGSFKLDQWHQILDSLSPVEQFLQEKYLEALVAT